MRSTLLSSRTIHVGVGSGRVACKQELSGEGVGINIKEAKKP
jgi:hypothetical protein